MGKRRLTKGPARPQPSRKKSHWAFWAISAAVLVVLGGVVGYFAFWRQPEMARVGQPAPDFTLRLLNGDSITLSSLKGRPVLINFWHST
jgi:cytochrome oxidase Cu insertion factor (SCO1/SenC/PrrC family)